MKTSSISLPNEKYFRGIVKDIPSLILYCETNLVYFFIIQSIVSGPGKVLLAIVGVYSILSERSD